MSDYFDDFPEIQNDPNPDPDRKASNKATAARSQTIFRVALALVAAIVIFFAGFFTYYLTLDRELRSLLWFKKQIQSQYYQPISDDEFWNAAIDGVEGILDDYSELYTAKEYDEVIASSQGIKLGTGASFFYGTNLIYKVAINSPAFFAGVEEGTYVTGVGHTRTDIRNTFNGADLSAAFDAIEDGEEFYLRVSAAAENDTESAKLYAVKKEEYTESYAFYATSESRWALVREESGLRWKRYGEGIEGLNTETAYIRLIQFYGNAYESVAQAMRQYREDGKTQLIFDLRNNGGGSVDIMCAISSYFLKTGTSKNNVVMSAQYRNGKRENYAAKGNYYGDYLQNTKLYAMANHNSASASEALLGAMISYGALEYKDIFVSRQQDNNVTCRTYGKGIMQTTYPHFTTGEAAKLTTAKIYWPNGECIHGDGINITDDGVTPIDVRSSVEYNDPELQQVLQKIG